MLTGTKRQPEAPDVPLFVEQAPDDETRKLIRFVDSVTELGWSFFTPPDVPQQRVAALRTAFAATLKDPGFRAAATQSQNPIDYGSGAEIDRNRKRIVEGQG